MKTSTRNNASSTFNKNDEKLMSDLKKEFGSSLWKELCTNNCDTFPIRYWIIDNSYSMTQRDGHLILQNSSEDVVRTIACSRYDEIKECVNFHAELSSLISAPTEFRLLNDPKVIPQSFVVGQTDLNNYNDFKSMENNEEKENIMPCVTHQEVRRMINRTEPKGLTPLVTHINELRSKISNVAPKLRQNGQKAVIVIATDGLPTETNVDGHEKNKELFVKAMRSLEGLPIWIVIRLCTDDEHVVNFYNDLDEQLELSLEVLDDFESEALEVYEHNKWLNYTLPIHRLREAGFYDRVFDLIDERALTKSELRQFFMLLFGEENFDSIPDPSIDWMGFLEATERLLRLEGYNSLKWNPVKKKAMPLIDTYELNKKYGEQSNQCGCIMM